MGLPSREGNSGGGSVGWCPLTRSPCGAVFGAPPGRRDRGPWACEKHQEEAADTRSHKNVQFPNTNKPMRRRRRREEFRGPLSRVGSHTTPHFLSGRGSDRGPWRVSGALRRQKPFLPGVGTVGSGPWIITPSLRTVKQSTYYI